MRNHLKIIRTLYSPHLITEILLAAELVLLVQLLALATNPASYYLQQICFVDSCWKDGSYIYYLPHAVAEPLDPEEVRREYPALEAYYCSDLPLGNTLFKEDRALRDANGNGPGIYLTHYNEAMEEKAGDALKIREDIDTGDTVPLFVPPAVTEVFPLGTVLTSMENYDPETRTGTETKYTVCGIIQGEQIPVISSASLLDVTKCFTVNTREMADQGKLLFIACDGEDRAAKYAVFRAADGADAGQLAAALNKRYESLGQFYTYASMRAATLSENTWLSTTTLLQGLLLLLVFVSHFVGYLAVSTRNKERTNALLGICGITPARLSGYNVCAVLLILLPSYTVGMLLVPLAERLVDIKVYGGHAVLWYTLAASALFILLMTFLTVRVRMKKGSTILLYKKGT